MYFIHAPQLTSDSSTKAMRINPPAVISFPRTASQDTELGGTMIPKGTPVYLDIFELHHNPTVWKDPDTFNAERFVLGSKADQVGGSAWLSFLRGPRQCTGMNFSLVEQRVFLSMSLPKYEFRLPSDSIHKGKLITTGRIIAGPRT
ncbi:cytochrome P450 [Fennellomyces sp. T-0311]|nr:cytochrome P450 [Fennellomyces sp. T-0311]